MCSVCTDLLLCMCYDVLYIPVLVLACVWLYACENLSFCPSVSPAVLTVQGVILKEGVGLVARRRLLETRTSPGNPGRKRTRMTKRKKVCKYCI